MEHTTAFRCNSTTRQINVIRSRLPLIDSDSDSDSLGGFWSAFVLLVINVLSMEWFRRKRFEWFCEPLRLFPSILAHCALCFADRPHTLPVHLLLYAHSSRTLVIVHFMRADLFGCWHSIKFIPYTWATIAFYALDRVIRFFWCAASLAFACLPLVDSCSRCCISGVHCHSVRRLVRQL